MGTVRRRLASVTNHLNPVTPPANHSLIALSSTSSVNNSYYRIHGEVSNEEVVWRNVCDESGKEFTDIIYEKAVGEGIAKV